MDLPPLRGTPLKNCILLTALSIGLVLSSNMKYGRLVLLDNNTMKKKGKLKQIILDDELAEMLTQKAKRCGIDEASFIKVLIAKCEVQVLSGNTEVKMDYEEVKKEWIEPKVERIKKALDIPGVHLGSEVDRSVPDMEPSKAKDYPYSVENYRKAKEAYCMQYDVADANLLGKKEEEWIKKNTDSILNDEEFQWPNS